MDPRNSAEFIAGKSKHVKIRTDPLAGVAKDLYDQLAANKLRIESPSDHPTFPEGLSEDEAINYLFVLDTLNFCFWNLPGEPRYQVEYKGVDYSGYYALCAAVARAHSNGISLFDPNLFLSLTSEDLSDLLAGNDNIEIPMVQERFDCLQEVGQVLLDKYNGEFINCVKSCDKSAEELLSLILTEFPCFRDEGVYHGQSVSFHKRAQILVADIWCLQLGKGISEFTDIDHLTMFADYRVPQVLVSFGLLEYTPELIERLKKNEILASGCVEEIEIRGCSIEVVESLLEALYEHMKGKTEYYCNSAMIDFYLWNYRRANAANLETIPFHKVRSIYY